MPPKVNEGNCSLWIFQNLIGYIILIDLCRIQGAVITHNKDVELGGKATLRCTPSKLYETIQVTWLKQINGSLVNIAVYHNVSGPKVFRPEMQFNFTVLGLNETAITFWNASIQDNGCYQCIFNTFPSGPVTGKPCLSVYAHLDTFIHYKTSETHTSATCFATSFPRPQISWHTPGGKMNETQVTNPNGTVTVMSGIFVNTSRSQAEQELICRVKHRGKEVDLKLALPGRGHSHQNHAVLILLSIMTMVLPIN
ncbi:OX-2 membrane glycoprotein [Anolis sagrei]|uniref:OX-2 membrane glycoprotein n=1 Tax=Anolis sagrei TaxID=38937 RepID=UPI0035201D80